MTKRRFALALLCLGIPPSGVSSASADDAQARRDRLIGETIALFAAVRATTDVPATPCVFATKWDNYPIPRSVAVRHLGLTIDADLVPSDQPVKLVDVIDPTGVTAEAFCDMPRTSTAPGEAERAAETPMRRDGQPTPMRRHVEYTFPVFSRDYQIAVFVSAWSSYAWYANPGMPAQWQFVGLTGAAQIYEKRETGWTLKASRELFHMH